MDSRDAPVVLVVGGGVAGLSAALFTAKNGLETTVVDAGASILRRNAHLENFPGFPGGVNPRLLLDLLADQATDAGCSRVDATVTALESVPDGFRVTTASGDDLTAEYVIAATKNETGFLDDIDGVRIIERGSHFVETDGRGRTGIDGLYAAGRLAEKPHQAIVCAGHGAEVAVTLLEDHDAPFYHDWVVPTGYFTDRGRPVPPGCAEIDGEARRARERRALEGLRERLESPHPDEPDPHPSLADE